MMDPEKPDIEPGFDDDKPVTMVASEAASTQLTWTEEEEAAIRRKVDWHIVPLVTVLYLLCFIDRSNIGNARIQGMAQDLKLVGYRFNWALTAFYMGYFTVEVPSNVMLKRIGPRYWIPFLVFGFGLISMCTAFVKNYSQLCAMRVLLGIFEGGTMPGIAFFLSCFYRRHELYFRVGIFVSSSSMAGAFGGLLATALSRIPKWGSASSPIHTWRNIFFFEGLVTMLVALSALYFLPNAPSTCHFLSEHEQAIATERMAQEHKADETEKVQLHHIKSAVFSVTNNICACGFFLINITVQGLSIFIPTILSDLGWTATKAQLYSVPPYVMASAISILIAYISDKTRLRGIYLALFALITISGFSVLRWDENANIRYMAVFFAAVGAFPGGPGFLSWGINNAAGPAVRAVSGAYIVSIGTLGGFVAVWTYVQKDAPKYHTGHTINLGAEVAVLVLTLGGIAYCVYENRARARGKRDHRLTEAGEEKAADLGYLHPSFRFMP